MVDSCRQLITVSQSNGDEDTAGMVTILTGHQVEQLCSQSTAMKVRHLLTQKKGNGFFFAFVFMRIHRITGCIEQRLLFIFKGFLLKALELSCGGLLTPGRFLFVRFNVEYIF